MRFVLALLLLLPLALMGCGGGGGSTGPAPVVSITAQPVEQTVVEGQQVQFIVSASNASGYQWQSDTSGSWSDIAGATQATYSIASATLSMDGQQYRVLVTGREGQVISSAVALRVTAAVIAPSVTVAPAGVTGVAGEDVVFNVTAAGTSLSYQWQQSTDGVAWNDIAGATAAQLRLQEVNVDMDGNLYRARVSNSAGQATSLAATLRVDPTPVAPSFTSQPAGVSVVEGQTATFTVTAAGTPIPELKWQVSLDGSAWTDLSGATASAYTTPPTTLTQSGQWFRAVATNSAGSVNSAAVSLTVGSAPVAPSFSAQPRNVAAVAGVPATFTATVQGTPRATLQWQISSDAVNWSNINGATADTYTVPAVSAADHGRLFRLVATNTAGTAISDVAAISVETSANGSPSLSLLFGTLGGRGSLDGTGATARLFSVSGLAFDASGRLIVSEAFGQTVRRMSPAGELTTWVGVYGGSRSADGTGVAARLSSPRGATVDAANNAYVVDTANGSVRKISPSGAVTTVAQLKHPRAAAVDAAGNLFVCDLASITRIAGDGTVSTLAGSSGVHGHMDGTGAAARFDAPEGIALATNGDLIVADVGSHTLRRVTPAGVVTTIAGTPDTTGSDDGPGGSATFYQPSAVAVDGSGRIYVGDRGNSTIRGISPTGVVSTVAGATGSPGDTDGPLSEARFSFPDALAVGEGGDLYVGDGDLIRKISGSMVTTVAGKAVYGGYGIWGVVADSLGNVYVGDSLVKAIRKIAPDGSTSILASIDSPAGLAIDSANNVYFANYAKHTIEVISPDGVVRTLAGSAGNAGSADGVGSAARFNQPNALAVDASGNVYVTDFENHTIRKVQPDGTVSTFSGAVGEPGFANGLAASARFRYPASIAVNSAGQVFVSDASGAVRRLDATGRATALAGVAESDAPMDGVGTDARFGAHAVLSMHNDMLHAADSGTIRTVNNTGSVATIAGVRGQIGIRLGGDARLGFVSAMAPLDANRLVIAVNSEQSIVVLTK